MIGGAVCVVGAVAVVGLSLRVCVRVDVVILLGGGGVCVGVCVLCIDAGVLVAIMFGVMGIKWFLGFIRWSVGGPCEMVSSSSVVFCVPGVPLVVGGLSWLSPLLLSVF